MTDRDRLIELYEKATEEYEKTNKAQFRKSFICDYLLANGVIVPPCKVGDKLFCIISDRGINDIYNHIEVCKVTSIMCFDSESFVIGVREINRHYSHNVVLGKDAFNTFEEADKKLKELNDNG